MFEKIRSDSISSVVFQVLGYATTFIIGIYIVKKLSVNAFGAFSLFNVFIMIAPAVITFNVQDYFLVNISPAKKPEENFRLFSTIGLFVIMATIVIGGLIAIPPISKPLLAFFDLSAYPNSFYFVLGYLLLYGICLNYLRFFRFTQAIRTYNILYFLIIAAWMIPVLIMGVSVDNIFLSRLLIVLATATAAMIIFKIYHGHIGYGFAFDKKLLKDALIFGAGTYIGTMSGLLMDVTDKLMLSAMVGNKSVGLYNFATMPFMAIVSFMNGTVFLIAVPYINEMHHRNDIAKYDLYFQLMQKIVLYLSPILVFLVVFARDIIIILGKTEYLQISGAFGILAVSYLILILVRLPKQELYLTRRLKILNGIALTSLALNFLMDLFLIKYFDYMGAIYASLVARLFMIVMLLGLARIWRSGLAKIGWTWRWIILLIMTGLGARLAQEFCSLPDNLALRIVILIGLFAVFFFVYTVGLFLFGLMSDREKNFLRKVLKLGHGTL